MPINLKLIIYAVNFNYIKEDHVEHFSIKELRIRDRGDQGGA